MSTCFPQIKVTEALVFSNFDSLGLGSLLSLLRHPQIQFGPARILKRRKRLILYVSFAFYACIYLIYRKVWSSIWIYAFENTFLAVFFACLINNVSKGVHGIPGKILGFKPFLYLGKISYGLYIFHNLAVLPLAWSVKYLHLPQSWADVLPVRLFVLSFWTVAAAALSWHLYESPINNLKKKFPYMKKA